MNMKSSAKNIKLTSLDDMFGLSNMSSTDNADNESTVQQLPLDKLHSFHNHPFKVKDDVDMAALVDSIAESGILTPLLVRSQPNGEYEIISGHRRTHAAKLIGLVTLPAIVLDMGDEDAAIHMVDANLQREHILPSEKAWAYRIKLDAMKRQGQRSDLSSSQVGIKSNADDSASTSSQVGIKSNAGDSASTSSQVGIKSNAGDSASTSSQVGIKSNAGDSASTSSQVGIKSTKRQTLDILGEQVGESRNQIHRYIRLTYLISSLLDMVDTTILKFIPAVEVSYLSEEAQKVLHTYMLRHNIKNISLDQAKLLRISKDNLTESELTDIFNANRRSRGKRSDTIILNIPMECIPEQHRKTPPDGELLRRIEETIRNYYTDTQP